MRRATRRLLLHSPPFIDISIHALHEESDLGTLAELPGLGISIHALHEESDRVSISAVLASPHFNPRSP